MDIPGFLYNIKEINIEEGVKNCGSEESFLETLTTFADTSEKIADDTEGFWKVFDIKNTTLKAHAIKSMLRIIGSAELSSLAERLENAGNETDLKTLEIYLPKLIESYRKLSADLQPLLNASNDQQDLPVIEEEKLQEIYKSIVKFAKNFDYDSIDDTIEELGNYQIPEEEQETYSKLKEVVENFDYDMVSEILAEKI